MTPWLSLAILTLSLCSRKPRFLHILPHRKMNQASVYHIRAPNTILVVIAVEIVPITSSAG